MDTLNSLYLELSTVCEVKTHRETVLEDLLGSVRAIASRKGKNTDWPALASVLKQEGIETNFQFNFESFEPPKQDPATICPHCQSTLLWSEDRGPHCDGCEEFNGSTLADALAEIRQDVALFIDEEETEDRRDAAGRAPVVTDMNRRSKLDDVLRKLDALLGEQNTALNSSPTP